MRKKQLTFFFNSLRAGLGFRGFLLEALKKEGYDIEILAPKDLEIENIEKFCNKYTPIKMNANTHSFLNNLYSFLTTLKILCTKRKSYFFVYTVKPILEVSIASFFLKIHYTAFLTGLGRVFENTNSKLYKFLRILLGASLKRAQKIILLNSDDIETLKSIYPQLADKFLLMPGEGINLQHYKASKKPLYSSKPTHINFLYVGRLLKSKGIPELVEAFNTLKQNTPFCKLHLVGPYDASDSESISKSLFNEINTNPNICYHGAQKDVRPFLEECDVAILPSRKREGLSRFLLEAMAYGKILLASDVPGNRDLIQENGYLFKAQSSKEIQKLIIKISSQPKEQLEMMSNKSLKHVKNHSSQEIILYYQSKLLK